MALFLYKRRDWIFSLLSGLLLAFGYLEWLRADTEIGSLISLVLVYIYATLLFSGLVYWLQCKWACSRLVSHSARWKVLWFLFFALFGVWLTVAIPVDFPVFSQNAVLKIIATGESNSESQGNEVWVSRLVASNGNSVPFSSFSLGDGWEIRKGALFTNRAGATLTWSGRPKSPMHLVFVAHPWSGIVRVEWGDDFVQTIDLFDPNGKEIDIVLQPVVVSPGALSKILILLSAGYGIGILLFLLSIWVSFDLNTLLSRQSPKKFYGWILYAVPIGLGFLFYWLVYYPAIMGSDVNDQWGQMLTLNITDAHPAFHTLYFWVLTRIWKSPASVALFQILLFTLLGGKILALFEEHGAPITLLGVIAIVFGFNPINALNVISLWKDTIFAACFLWAVLILLKIILDSGKWLEKKLNVVGYGLLLALISLFRHNGITISLGFLLGLGMLYRSYIKHIFMMLGAMLVVIFMVRGPLYEVLHVPPTPKRMAYSWIAHNIAYHLVKGTPLSDEEAQYLNNLYPVGTKWYFEKYCSVSVSLNPDFKWSVIDFNFFKIFIDLNFFKSPRTFLEYLRDQSSLVWRIRTLDGYVWAFHEPLNEVYIVPRPNELSTLQIRPHSFLPTVAKKLSDWVTESRLDNGVNWLLWRPAIYLYLTLIVVVVKILKEQNLSWGLLLFPLLTQSITMALLIPCQDFRYQFPVYAVSLIVIPLLFLESDMHSMKVHTR